MTQRHKHVINRDEVKVTGMGQGAFGYTSQRLGTAGGGRALGCSYIEVAPGKTGFPCHFHSAIEEALYILEGSGSLRIGADVVRVGPGDYVTFPAGPETAHQLTNDGELPLRYLAMSGPATPAEMDIVGYPDSKKIAFFAGVKPGLTRDTAWVFKLIKEDQPKVEYYEDEPLAQK